MLPLREGGDESGEGGLESSMVDVAMGESAVNGAQEDSLSPLKKEGSVRRRATTSADALVACELAFGDGLNRCKRQRGKAAPTIVPVRAFSHNDLAGLASAGLSVDQGAIESFLLYMSRTLGMDLGELWSVGLLSSLQMTKLYIEPEFYERHSARIIYPTGDPRSKPEAQHVHSKGLCTKALTSGAPVWCELEVQGDAGLPLRTAAAIPFNTDHSFFGKDRTGDRSSDPAVAAPTKAFVLVMYSSRRLPLPSEALFNRLAEFSRSVATTSSMMRLLSHLSHTEDRTSAAPAVAAVAAAAAAAAVEPNHCAASVHDRLGLAPSLSVPTNLSQLDHQPPQEMWRRERSCASLRDLDKQPTPAQVPRAPRLGAQGKSTFAQRRMRQLADKVPVHG